MNVMEMMEWLTNEASKFERILQSETGVEQLKEKDLLEYYEKQLANLTEAKEGLKKYLNEVLDRNGVGKIN